MIAFFHPHNPSDWIIALGAVLTALENIHSTAYTGRWDESHVQDLIRPVFTFSATPITDLYAGHSASFERAYRYMLAMMGPREIRRPLIKALPWLPRYTWQLYHVTQTLSKRPRVQADLRQRLIEIRPQIDHFGPTHPHVIKNLSSAHVEILGHLSTPIRLAGHPRYVQADVYIDRIRTLLLCGIRAMFLFQQSQGSLWKLWWHRALLRQQLAGWLRV